MSMSQAELNAMLAGLDADPWEREQLREAMDEAAADDPGSYDPDGPWHDFESAAAQMDRSQQLDAARIGEDIVAELDRRPSAEDKLVRAFRRIEAGTYTPAPQPGYDAGGRTDACGPLDDFGRCGAAFHDRGCHQVAEASAATGDADAARAWRSVLAGYVPPAEALGLATPDDGEDLWSDLLSPPGGGSDRALREQMLAIVGGEGRAEQPRPVMPSRQPLPDVSGLRTSLGL